MLDGFEKEPVSLIGVALRPYAGRPEDLLAEEIDRDKGRAFRVEARPGFREGEREGLMLRRWGRGTCTRAEGQPWHFHDRASAIECGRQWIATGR